MTYQFSLDTNVLSDLVKHPQGGIFQHIVAVGEDSVCTSIAVMCELRFRAAKSGSYRLVQQLERVLNVLPVFSLEQPVAQHYASI